MSLLERSDLRLHADGDWHVMRCRISSLSVLHIGQCAKCLCFLLTSCDPAGKELLIHLEINN